MKKLPVDYPVWTGSEMIRELYPPKPLEDHPGWVEVACGCCSGIKWGGDYPQECEYCNQGFYVVHLASGIGALYPGGPFNGMRFEQDADS